MPLTFEEGIKQFLFMSVLIALEKAFPLTKVIP